MQLKVGQKYTAIVPCDQTQFSFTVESKTQSGDWICQPEFPKDSGYKNLLLSLGEDDVEDWQIKPLKS